MGRWMVQLTGSDIDLERLMEDLHDDDIEVRKENGMYLLLSSEFSRLSDPSHVRDVAKGIINRINNAMLAIDRQSKPVGFDKVIERCDDGRSNYHVFLEASIPVRTHVRASVTVGTGSGTDTAVKQPPLLRSLLQLQERDDNVKEILEWYRDACSGDEATTFIMLYKIGERIGVINDREKEMRDTLGVYSRKEMKRFRQAANVYRHGWPNSAHAKKTMSSAEAIDLFSRIINKWLDERLKQLSLSPE